MSVPPKVKHKSSRMKKGKPVWGRGLTVKERFILSRTEKKREKK